MMILILLIGVVPVSFASVESAIAETAEEENKATVQKFIEEVFNKGKLDGVEKYFSPNYTHHNPDPNLAPGVEGFKQVHTMLRTAFPDLRVTVGLLIAEGDKVAGRTIWQGTHKGEFQGIAPTNQPVTLKAIEIWRLAEGKFTEHWIEADIMGLMQQLGVMGEAGHIATSPSPAKINLRPQSGGRMSLEENKAIFRRFLEEGFNKGNVAVLDEVLAADYVDHTPAEPAAPQQKPGPERLKGEMVRYRQAFPDARFTVDDQIAEGDMVVSRWTFRGTHKGNLMDMPPTGKQVTMTGMTISRIADGKIAEEWVNYNMLGMLQQLGAIPPPGQTEK